MKNTKRIAAILMTISMLLCGVACKKDKETEAKKTTAKETTAKETTVTETEAKEKAIIPYTSVQELSAAITDKLGIPEYEHTIVEASTTDNSSFGMDGTIFNANYEGNQIVCYDYTNPDDARARFSAYSDSCQETVDGEYFEGEYKSVLEDDHGYFVIDATCLGSTLCGDVNASGRNVYVGYYYTGSLVLYTFSTESYEATKHAIEVLGLPMADGTNC